MQKLLKAWYFMNSMHEYDMKYFSKNTYIEPRSPKNKIFNQYFLKFSNFKHILH